MGIDVGSRVRFLNEVGGGEVVKKVDSRRWLVRTEDGFELPMYESELVIDTPPELVALTNKPATKEQDSPTKAAQHTAFCRYRENCSLAIFQSFVRRWATFSLSSFKPC